MKIKTLTVALVALTVVGCGASGSGQVAQTGGATSSGGQSQAGGRGGGAGGGGGGTSSSGGTTASGGSSTTGGTTASGGVTTTGGSTASGGSKATGGNASGGATTTGGTSTTGGATTTGGRTGAGGTGTGGGTTATGGATVSGGRSGSGGSAVTGGATGTGGSSGTGGSPPATTGPCDIYAAASPATPCVGAYSMTRSLYGGYTGPLYQVRKGGTWDKTNGPSGGTFKDIGIVGGYADAAAQDAFCVDGTCTVSTLYDQSGKKNDLKAAPAGCYTGGDGAAAEYDKESLASRRSTTLNGHKVYALQTLAHEGYRNNKTSGMVTGTQAQGVYMVADGRKAGTACCWDFGNAMPTNCADGTGSMNALMLGTGFFGRGAGNGPWFMGDFEFGVWACGSQSDSTKCTNPNLPAMNTTEFAFGILKTSTSGSTGQYCLRTANAQSGPVTTAHDGQAPQPWHLGGAIILGIGGDNSNWSFGTFFEGVITAGRPSDATDALVLANVQAAKYGQ